MQNSQHGNTKNSPKYPRRYKTEEFTLFEGDVRLYRVNASGDIWQFSTWISEEKKYFRKSLRTKDRELAQERARELFYEIQGKIRVGEKLFDITIREVVDQFLEEQQKRVRVGDTGGGKIGITEGRFSTIRTQSNRHLVPFLGEKTKLQDIDGNQFRNSYTQWRKKRSPNVTDVTIINERATIGSVFRFAFDKQWIRQNQLPRWEEMKKNVRSRDALELDEWREVYTYLRTWTKNDTEDHVIFQKNMVREFILILANTGLRFGELRHLRWGNVRLFTEKDENGRDEVKSRIDVEISKTGRRQDVIGMRGDLFQRLKKHTEFTDAGDYIFADPKTGEMLNKKIYYRHWDEIIRNTSLKSKHPKPTFYCLRHTYATFRLMEDVPVFDIAENMGTSVKFIEEHYGHVKRIQRSHVLTQRKANSEKSKSYLSEF